MCRDIKQTKESQRMLVARLRLKSGEILPLQIIETDDTGKLLYYKAFTHEMHSTIWYKGEWVE